MPNLIIRFIAEPDLISRLIEWQTDSIWCHTEALSRDGQSWIGAHAGSGVESRPLNWCKPIRESRYAIPVADAQYEASMAWLESQVGKPYNYADIIGLTLHSRKGASDHEIICSALMLLYMEHAGLWPLNTLAQYAYLITPETLHLSPVFMGRAIYHLS